MVSSALLGVGIGVVGKGVSSLGLILQKVSHARNITGLHFCKDTRWMFGFLTYFVGNLIVILSLTMAPQVLIGSLDSLVLVYNALLAPYFLDSEKFTSSDLKACLLVVFGVGLVVYFGPRNNREYSSEELLDMMVQGPFVVYSILSLSTCLFLYMYLRHARLTRGERYVKDEQSVGGNLMAVAAGTIPAILSSYNLQLSKIVGELVSQSLGDGNNEFLNWPLYMFLLMLISCNTVQVVTLQTALANYSALLIIPIFQVQLTILAIINGGIYFSEFENWESGGTWVWFIFGIICCIAGICLLATRSMSGQPSHHPDSTYPRQDSHLVRKDSFGRRQKRLKRFGDPEPDWQEGDGLC
eukprot:TRINITY_DN6660_c3_g1_i1.p1 TRINITY_DN6660_c3_g1~~TRINITY_DN6660_c3_g1_i1.p1  ORF type:complete len:371 (+),score=47.18 TRINITY_DN6660_c3_g1_i1:51-1115(+)